jgi:hypothetical protein
MWLRRQHAIRMKGPDEEGTPRPAFVAQRRVALRRLHWKPGTASPLKPARARREVVGAGGDFQVGERTR